MYIKISRVESTNSHPLSKKCEKFKLFMPVSGSVYNFSVFITVTHIAAICDHVECGFCRRLLLMLIELVHSVSTCFLPADSFFFSFPHSSFPFLLHDCICSNDSQSTRLDQQLRALPAEIRQGQFILCTHVLRERKQT